MLVFVLLAVFVIMRAGLVATVLAVFVETLLSVSPMTLHAAAWYASIGYVVFAVVLGISLAGFKTSIGGQPFVTELGLDDA